MGHFSVAVITNHKPNKDTLFDILEPFHFSDCEEYYELEKFDYWEIGGRWENLFTTKQKESVNTCLIRELDFESAEAQATSLANQQYDLFERLLGDKPKDWITLTEIFADAKIKNYQELNKEYREQETIMHIRSHPDFNDLFMMKGLSIDDFKIDREEYVKQKASLVFQCHNVLLENELWDDNSGWYGGDVSIFGVSKQVDDWNQIYKELLNKNKDNWITVIDCKN